MHSLCVCTYVGRRLLLSCVQIMRCPHAWHATPTSFVTWMNLADDGCNDDDDDSIIGTIVKLLWIDGRPPLFVHNDYS